MVCLHGVSGNLESVGATHGRAPVAFDELLCVLDPAALGEQALSGTSREVSGSSQLSFPSPSSGRFYARPSPDAPPFVAAGDEVKTGQTVAILEVMKTFNRIAYGGTGLPERARITRVVPEDQRNPMLQQVRLGRLGEGDDLANAVVFLASPAAAYVTGETLHVNGGMLMD